MPYYMREANYVVPIKLHFLRATFTVQLKENSQEIARWAAIKKRKCKTTFQETRYI